MSAHARLSPSNHRWPNCPGSVALEAQYPDIAGEAAIDGTGSHLLLEMCLNNDYTPSHYEGRVIGVNHEDKPDGWLVNQDRIDRVQMCLDYIERRKQELREQFPNATIIVQEESRSDPGGMFGRDDWQGTCDVTLEVIDGDDCLFIEVIDYKDGRGWVHAENNTQLISYAGGKMRPWIASGKDLVRPFHPERIPHGVRTSIVQPKTTPPIRYHDYATADITKELESLSWKATQTDQEDAPLVPGKHCQWCKHKPHCTAQSEESLEVLKMSNDVVAQDGHSLFELIEGVIDDVAALDTQRLTELADARAGIEAAFDRVEAELYSRLEQGQPVDGYALKPGRMTSVWNESEEDIVKMLKGRRLKRDDIYPPKLASPAQIMKSANLTDEQKEKIEKQYISKKAGSLKLTKVERKTAEVSFDDVAQLPTNDVPSFF